MKKEPPIVSVGLPIYNGGKYLQRSITSLLAQEYKNFEVIISDNASNDETEEICRKYADQDSRIHYYRNEFNIGSAANFNKTLQLSIGKYFMWFAHDDWLEPTYISKCLNAMEKNTDALFCCTDIHFTNDLGEIICPREYALINEKLDLHERVRQYLLRYGCYEIVYGLFNSSKLKETKLFQEVFGPDFVLGLELVLKGKWISINEKLFHYRWNPKTIQNYADEISTNSCNRENIIKKPFYQLANEMVKTINLFKYDNLKSKSIKEHILQVIINESDHWLINIIHEFSDLFLDPIGNRKDVLDFCKETMINKKTIQQVKKEMKKSMLQCNQIKKPIYIWGAGLEGIIAYSQLLNQKYEVGGFIDNNLEIGSTRNRLPVYHSSFLYEFSEEDRPFIIIASSENSNIIKESLCSAGYLSGINYRERDYRLPFMFFNE